MSKKSKHLPTPQRDERPKANQSGGESHEHSIEDYLPADTADQLESLPFEEQVALIRALEPKEAAESIAEMEKHDRIELLRQLAPDKAAQLIEDMSPDDAADILEEVGEEYAQALLRRVNDEDAAEIEQLLKFDSNTAGGVMNTEIVVMNERLTVDQAIRLIREEIRDKEIPYYAYIVDDEDHLLGVLSMRDLLLSKPGTMLGALIKTQTLVAATFDVDREEVAHLIRRYNFLAVPVVDYEDRLLGVVTHDDVMDIIHEEATEDMQKMVGAGSDETVDSPWTYSISKRLPWLIVNMLNSAVSAWVVHLFEGSIAEMAILAVLMPMVANQAGNTGQQALAVMIRQLAMDTFDRKRSWMAVLRELKIGLANGVLIAGLAFAVVFFITAQPRLAAVMAAALYIDMLLGSLAGASIPLLLKELGKDPAQSSSIFLTTLTDSFGFFCLLGLANLYLLAS
jgi:magnesium transporter